MMPIIGYWKSMTNSHAGATLFGLLPSALADEEPHNLIGLNVNANYSDLIPVCHCQFTFCLGLSWASDHGYIYNNIFESCGRDDGSPMNQWPANSPYYIGAAITFYDPIPLVSVKESPAAQWRASLPSTHTAPDPAAADRLRHVW